MGGLQLYIPSFLVKLFAVTSNPVLLISISHFKSMLRRKNHLVRAGRTKEATALAVKTGAAIKAHNSVELCKVDVLSNLSDP